MSSGEKSLHYLRFLVSGATGFAIYYVFALLLNARFGFASAPSAIMATLIAVPPAFFLQRKFTFRSEGNGWHQFAAYVLLQVVCSLIIGFAAYLGESISLHRTVTFFVAGVAGVVFSYVVQRTLIFKH